MGESVSLFLDLEPGRKADLEVVARASLSFTAAVKELTFILDPSLEIRIELASGTEGSLSINSIIRAVRERITDATTLKAVALVVLGWFANDLRGYAVSELLDRLLKPEQIQQLSDDDVERIVEAVAKALEGQVAKQHVESVFRQLERDEAIKGVGATPEPGTRPGDIIPRDRFRQRAGAIEFIEDTPERRTRRSPERVTLISPVLIPGQRRWRFSFREGEFGAPIKHEEFLDSVLSARIPIPLAAGIELDVLLETKEEFQDGVWVIKERNILHVFGVHPAPRQELLRFPLNPPNQGDDDNNKDGNA